jgi:hypothetical protein
MLKRLDIKTILNIKKVSIFKDEIIIHFVNTKGNDPLSIIYIQKLSTSCTPIFKSFFLHFLMHKMTLHMELECNATTLHAKNYYNIM